MDSKEARVLWGNKSYLAKGKRGVIWEARIGRKVFVLKSKNPEAVVNTIENEAIFNRKMNEIGIGPRFYYYDSEKKFLVREKIEGLSITEWIKLNPSMYSVSKVVFEILNQCRKMDKAGINKQELTHPDKDILITKTGKPFIIDYERCKFVKRPHNVNQFCQYLLKKVFAKCQPHEKSSEQYDLLIKNLRKYKLHLDDTSFNNLLSAIKGCLRGCLVRKKKNNN